MKTYLPVLTIAGFDGSGGAGIQADIKTFSALGCYATSVLTALPVQNTTGVKSIFPLPEKVVEEQLNCLLEDIPPVAVKIGMVHTPELAKIIGHFLSKIPDVPAVFDPVMVASSGDSLIAEDTLEAIRTHLLPRISLLTPNMDEAAILAEQEVKNKDDMQTAAAKILSRHPFALLMKGGHLPTSLLTSYLYMPGQNYLTFESERIETRNSHGSGCTLSSAIAAYLAQGHSVQEAVSKAQTYVHQALLHGKDVTTGHGHGPLNHFFNPQKLIVHDLV
jgi:hydroxymethylpyrimidine/phosphomethylpyrimidine kinase